MSEVKEDVDDVADIVDGESFISCRFCKKVFKSTEEYTKHFCKNLRKKQLYTCYVCKRHFNDLNVLSEHASHHPRKKFYKCYFCKKEFKNLTEQRNHIMLHKMSYFNEVLSDKFHLINLNKNDDSKVDEDNQTISSIKGNQFVKDEKIESYLCSSCNVTFPNMYELANHTCEKEKPEENKHYSLRSDHSKKKKHCYLCNNCNKSCEQECYSKSYLGLCKHCQSLGIELTIPKHTTKVHKTKPAEMKRVLSTIDNKKLQTIVNNEKRPEKNPPTNRCNICNSDFNDSSNLKQHMTTHETKSLFICVKCQQNFHDINEFKKHEETHKKYTLKSYSCKICKRPYKTLHSLIEHMRTHPEYSFTCENCHQLFTTLIKYEKHKTICDQENDVTDYTCEVCNVSFQNGNELEKHNNECEKFLDQFESVKEFVATQEACKNCGEHLQENPEDSRMFTELMDDLFKCDDCSAPDEKIVSCDNCLENIPDLFKNEFQSKYEILRKSPRMFEVKIASKNGAKNGDSKRAKDTKTDCDNGGDRNDRNMDIGEREMSCVEKLIEIGRKMNCDEPKSSFGERKMSCDEQSTFGEGKISTDEQKIGYGEKKINWDEPKFNWGEKKTSSSDQKISIADRKMSCDEPNISIAERKMSCDEPKSSFSERKMSCDEPKCSFSERKMSCDEPRFSIGERKMSCDKRKMSFNDKKSKIVEEKPKIDDGKSNIDGGKSNIDDGKLNIDDKKSNIDNRKPNTVDKKSNITDKKSNINDRKSNFNGKKSNSADKKSKVSDGKSNITDRKTRATVVQPNIVDIKPIDVNPNIGIVNPEIVEVKPNIGAESYDIGTVNLNIGTVIPNIGRVNPNIGATNPNIGIVNPNIEATNSNIEPINLCIRNINPNIGTTNPDIGATNPDIGATNPNIGITNPDIGATNPDIGATNPNIGITNPPNKTIDLNIGTVNLNIATVNPNNVSINPTDQSNQPIRPAKRNVQKKSLIDFVNDGGDESQIIDDKNVETIKSDELLDLLDGIDFNPETDVKDMSNFRDMSTLDLKDDIPNETFPCDVCGEEFDYINDLEVHKYIHSDKKSFICADCRNGFLDLFQLETHKCETKK